MNHSRKDVTDHIAKMNSAQNPAQVERIVNDLNERIGAKAAAAVIREAGPDIAPAE